MDSIHICGGVPLEGSLRVQGSKNAALPVLAATVLIPGKSILRNCPDISDVRHMMKLLESIGCRVTREADHTVTVDAANAKENRLPGEYVTRMRSSVILMGALLGRMGEASLDYPGGCVIGDRPIDMHTKALEELGAVYCYREDGFTAYAEELKGTDVRLAFPSVGATENLILAAVMAEGRTQITNPAREPEILELCCFLRAAGAEIEGDGGGAIRITGQKKLKETEYEIGADRIAASTYMLGCISAGGDIFLENAESAQLERVIHVLQQIGGTVEAGEHGIHISRKGRLYPVPYLETSVYPGFPTDLQSPLLAVLSMAEGESRVKETIFNGRFSVAQELNRMGAGITVLDNTAKIPGGRKLYGRQVMAEELRGGAALVVAGLSAEGITVVNNIHFINRGYENIARDFRQLGARI